MKRVADAKAARAQMKPWAKMTSPEGVRRANAFADALLARAQAAVKPSPAAQRKAIDALERLLQLDGTETNGGPAWDRTARETLGDALFAAGKPKEALAQFEKDLDAHPNRAIALLGAARSAKGAGEGEKARAHYAALVELWSNADADLPALAEARAGAKGNAAVASGN